MGLHPVAGGEAGELLAGEEGTAEYSEVVGGRV